MTLPTVSASVNTANLHPELDRRLAAFFAHPTIVDRCKIVSAERSRASQVRLWLQSQATGNPPSAANPYRTIGVDEQGRKWTGSYHMLQPDGRVHAVDLRRYGTLTWGQLEPVANTFGLRRTVPSEDWHYQAAVLRGGRLVFFDAPALVAPPTPVLPPAPVDPTEDDDAMEILTNATTRASYLLVGSVLAPMTGEKRDAYKTYGVRERFMLAEDFAAVADVAARQGLIAST